MFVESQYWTHPLKDQFIVLWRNANYEVGEVNGRIYVANNKLCWTDWPLWLCGTVYYDFPTRFPKYIRRKVKAIMSLLR